MNENTTPDNADSANTLLVLEPVDDDYDPDTQDDHENLDDEHDDNNDAPNAANTAPAEGDQGTGPHAHPAAEPVSPLDRVLSFQGFVDTPCGRRFFPTTDSLRWFVRVNQRELIQAGAVVKMGRRTFVCRPEIDEEIARITRESARREVAL